MKAISRSLFQLITHSYITLFAIILTCVVFLSTLNMVIAQDASGERTAQMAMMMTLTLCMFFGIYFGGALAALQNFYLWQINYKYKRSLLISILLIGGLLSLLMGPYLYQVVLQNVFIVLLPAALMLFIMHVLLGKTLVHKLLIPVIPGGIYFLYTNGLSLPLTIGLSVVVTTGLIVYMFNQSGHQKQITTYQEMLSLAHSGRSMSSPKLWIAFNKLIGASLTRLILNGRQQLDWMVSLPTTKVGFMGLMNGLVVIAMFIFLAPQKEALYDVFTLMMISMTMLNVIMECRNLVKQVKAIAHIYPGENHYALKNKLLFAVDKIMLWNAIVFISLILLYLAVFSAEVDILLLAISSLTIIVVSYSLLPYLLTLSWFNVNGLLVVSVVSYFIVVMFTLSMVRGILQTDSMFILSLVVLAIFYGVRSTTEYYFSRRPLEKLLG